MEPIELRWVQDGYRYDRNAPIGPGSVNFRTPYWALEYRCRQGDGTWGDWQRVKHWRADRTT